MSTPGKQWWFFACSGYSRSDDRKQITWDSLTILQQIYWANRQVEKLRFPGQHKSSTGQQKANFRRFKFTDLLLAGGHYDDDCPPPPPLLPTDPEVQRIFDMKMAAMREENKKQITTGLEPIVFSEDHFVALANAVYGNLFLHFGPEREADLHRAMSATGFGNKDVVLWTVAAMKHMALTNATAG